MGTPKTKKQILIIEDNEDTRHFLRHMLSKEYDILLAENAVLGIDFARNQSPDLILLDVMLPHLSGLDACGMLKKDEKTAHIPIIFLSAKSKVSDITSGLGLGADDYVAKPFDMKELLARIDVRLRASESAARGGDMVIIGDLRIDPANRSVRYKGKEIELTLTEFDILRCLASQPGEVINRKEIIEAVRSNSKKVINDRTIDVHVRSIRKKIPDITKHLSSVYGSGYRYDK